MTSLLGGKRGTSSRASGNLVPGIPCNMYFIPTSYKYPLQIIFPCNDYRNNDRILRNANAYFIPQPRIELVKRFPLFTLPTAWYSENDDKYNPSQPAFLKNLKKILLETL
jgi:hypothetical protein